MLTLHLLLALSLYLLLRVHLLIEFCLQLNALSDTFISPSYLSTSNTTFLSPSSLSVTRCVFNDNAVHITIVTSPSISHSSHHSCALVTIESSTAKTGSTTFKLSLHSINAEYVVIISA